MLIPKLIHFILGFSSDPSEREFFLCHLLAIKSAASLHPEHKIVIWVGQEPATNIYWEEAKTLGELIRITPPDQIYGVPLMHYAHKADVTRLQILREHGGIYLDLDTITVRNFDSIQVSDMAMAPEYNPNVGRLQGLCNATIIARRNASFLGRWLDTYEFFNSRGRDINWEFHSVKMPMILARQVPQEIQILPQDAFFKFDWSQDGYKNLLEKSVPLDGVYSIHLWESHIYDFLKNMDEETVMKIRESTYGRLANKYLSNKGS